MKNKDLVRAYLRALAAVTVAYMTGLWVGDTEAWWVAWVAGLPLAVALGLARRPVPGWWGLKDDKELREVFVDRDLGRWSTSASDETGDV